MPQTTDPMSADTSVPMGLAARLVGVLLTPKTTYAAVVAHPRVLGALLVGMLLVIAPVFVFMSTTVGQEATLDQQYRTMESFGFQLPPEAYEQMEQGIGTAKYWAAVSQLIVIPLAVLATSGLIIVIYNFLLGGEATFKQAMAIVAHAGLIHGVGVLFATPLNYAKASVASRANLALFAPFLPDTSFAARLLGVIDLFWVWWLVNLAIGVGVLYKKKTGPIATTFLAIFLVVAIAIAAIQSFAGA